MRVLLFFVFSNVGAAAVLSLHYLCVCVVCIRHLTQQKGNSTKSISRVLYTPLVFMTYYIVVYVVELKGGW